MKKHKLKNYLKIGMLLFGISLIFTNCQKDDDFKEQENNTKSNFRFNNLSLKDLKQKGNLQQSISKLSKSFDVNKSKTNKDGSFSKIDANDGSFTILTEEVYEVTTDSSATYSFKIENPILPTSSFENFILEIKNDTLINYYISAYQAIENPQEDDFPYSISFLPVDENLINIENLNTQLNSKILSVFSGGCTFLFETTDDCSCNGGSALILLDSWCSGGGGSTSSGTGDSGASSSGGGGSTNGNTTTGDSGLGAPMAVNNTPSDKEKIIECLESSGATIPPEQLAWLNIDDPIVLNIIKKMASRINKSKCHVMSGIILAYLEDTTQNFDEFVENKLECYGINDLANNIDFQNAKVHLVDFIEDQNDDEQGYEISRTNDNIGTNFVAGNWQGVVLGYGNDIIGGMHTHPDQGYPMFSAEDIYTLYNYYEQVDSNPSVSQHDVFLTLTTEADNQIETYMIKIKNFIMLRHIINEYSINPSNRRAMRRFNRKLTNNYRLGSNVNDYMRDLLQTFEDIKSELSMPSSALYLYKLNSSNNTFEKVQFDGSNPPIKTPCN